MALEPSVPDPWVFSWDELRRRHASQAGLYLEIFRIPPMSAGIYRLPAGGADPQTPHQEDEMYVVIRGQGQVRIAGKDSPVAAGSVVFVPAKVEHRFHSNPEPLEILVLFAPQETSPEAAPNARARSSP